MTELTTALAEKRAEELVREYGPGKLIWLEPQQVSLGYITRNDMGITERSKFYVLLEMPDTGLCLCLKPEAYRSCDAITK